MHHAYLYYGSLSVLPELVAAARALFKFKKENDPDVRVLEYEKFGIDEARGLKDMAQLRNISDKALFIIGVSSVTSEAQQALLKLFEEPQQGSIFVLLAPHGAIIPTLRSRLLIYPEEIEEEGKRVSVKTFLASPYKARSAEIAKLLKDDEGVRDRVRDFLQALEAELYKNLQKTKGNKAFLESLEDIVKVRSYTTDRSPSLKMLLEHLAVTLPTLTK